MQLLHLARDLEHHADKRKQLIRIKNSSYLKNDNEYEQNKSIEDYDLWSEMVDTSI